MDSATMTALVGIIGILVNVLIVVYGEARKKHLSLLSYKMDVLSTFHIPLRNYTFILIQQYIQFFNYCKDLEDKNIYKIWLQEDISSEFLLKRNRLANTYDLIYSFLNNHQYRYVKGKMLNKSIIRFISHQYFIQQLKNNEIFETEHIGNYSIADLKELLDNIDKLAFSNRYKSV